jgi:hypothetical protein
MSDWQEAQDVPPAPSSQPKEGLSPVGKGAMRGEVSSPSTPPPDDSRLPADRLALAESPAPVDSAAPGQLQDAEAVKINGSPEKLKQLNHLQGQNDLGYRGTCGLVASEQVMKANGLAVTENDVVNDATREGLCVTDSSPENNGGTSPGDRSKILDNAGISNHVETGKSTADLNQHVKDGKGVIAAVNAGELWDDPTYYGNGEANHAILVTGSAENTQGGLLGFFINDSGTNESGKFVDTKKMSAAWEQTGGILNVTDQPLAGKKSEVK